MVLLPLDRGTTPGMTTDPGADESTITDVLEGYAQGGFAGHFDVTDQCQIECLNCGTVSEPEAVPMSSLRRLEGASDPADMVAVVALTCPSCGTRGTVTLGYGPMASEQDADVLKNLRDDRADAKTPGNSAPGETAGDHSPPQ